MDLTEVITGKGPAPSLVMALIQRLPDDSLTAALANGGKAQFQWGTDRHLQADLYDAINQNTRATGQWKKGSVPEFPAWPRPARDDKTPATKPRVTVADLHARFNRR